MKKLHHRNDFKYILSVLSGLVLLFTFPISGAADTVVARHAPNGVSLNATSRAGFKGEFGTVLETLDADPTAAAPDIAAPTTSVASSLQLPFGGSAKDQAFAKAELTWEYGSPLGANPNDRFEFVGDGTLSAETATAAAGENVDFATISLAGSLLFFLDPSFSATPVGTYVGDLNLPGLPVLLPYETGSSLKINEYDFFGAPVSSTTLISGSPGATVQLFSGNAYSIDISYGAQVPFGIDPPFAFSYSGLVVGTAVPVPPALWLFASALVGLLIARRKHSAAPVPAATSSR